MGETDSLPSEPEPRIAVAPNILVHPVLEPGAECLYIFNIYPIREDDPQLVVVPREEVERMMEVDRLIGDPFARTESVRLLNASFETHDERLEWLEHQRSLISLEHGVGAEEVIVTEVNKRDAERIVSRMMSRRIS